MSIKLNEGLFEPNLNPQREDQYDDDFEIFPEIFELDITEAMLQAEEAWLDEMVSDQCERCRGSGWLVIMGEKKPCPFGVKRLSADHKRLICFEPNGPAN